MSDIAELRAALFDALDSTQAGMLSVVGTDEHPQPMSPFADRDAGKIWFISKTDTTLVQSINGKSDAQFVLVAKSSGVHASIRGQIAQVHDRAKLEELWSPIVGAWFEGGIDDPKIALLCMDLNEAAVWNSDETALGFGWEILKANMQDDHTPDVGSFDIIRFAA